MTLDISYLTASVEEGILSVDVQQISPFLFFPNKNIVVHSHQSILLEEKNINES